MSRLADYFAVIGYDHENDQGGHSKGKILQRFPEDDWENCPFTSGIELFCQPTGWQLSSVRLEPTFFIAALTDIEADRHYCACMNFTEDVAKDVAHFKKILYLYMCGQLASMDDEEIDDIRDPELIQSAKVYAPKSLVLVSRLEYFETFRNCLGVIYTVYVESMEVELETLIGNILGCIQVPPPGGPQVRFSIGAGDRQSLQPPMSAKIPITNTTVATFFQELGLSNALHVFCAALTDHKVLFHSASYTRLTEASHAITGLMYPLTYSYVYIPLLPVGLIEVLSTPTPFIIGVHTSICPEMSDLLDVIVCDLDGGSIRVPEHLNIPLMPEPMYTRILHSLNKIVHPELLTADLAFPQAAVKPPAHDMLDKEIRAIFLRFFAELFFGYRSCLTIIRIHPTPFITFHKANFLGHRGLVEDDFTTKVLDSMSFMAFVQDRGPPYRVCDIFDEVFAAMQETLQIEEDTPERLTHNINDLGRMLMQNENPNPQPYQQKIPKPPDGVHRRVHQPAFPTLLTFKVQSIIEEGLAKQSLKNKLSHLRPPQPRIVPIGFHITTAHDKGTIIATNVRRLEVLRSCVTFIFENKISDARKIFPAVLRALKSRVARLALVQELSFHVQSNRAMLEHQQFDLVVRLLNCALQNDSSMDENGVAAAILPLATAFCRKLSTGVIQFAYSCVQEHAVWANHQFWEATFYQDVQQQIRQLYLPQYEQGFGIQNTSSRSLYENGSRSTPDQKRKSLAHVNSGVLRSQEISALEIAAEQLRVWPSLVNHKQEELINNEESTVFSQAIHYANRMVYLRVPLDANKNMIALYKDMGKGDSASSNITNSIGDSDSVDAESGFEEQEVSEIGAAAVKFVSRFVDKVCCESGVTSEHIKSLHQMIPGVVAMHIETLDAVFRESKLLPPIQKPKILTPILLPGEEIVMEGLRVYLVPDGREEAIGGNVGGPALLPAEGGIFLTTYRIIFKGTPVDPLACEQVVCRSFPVGSLTREKKTSVQYLAQIDQQLQEGLQLRSCTFQLLKIAFDEEVSSDDIEALRKLMSKLRSPVSVVSTFAFTGYVVAQASRHDKTKEKNASLKGFAKRTLMKTAKRAGLKTKDPTPKRQKYILPTPTMSRKTLPVNFGSHGEKPIYEEEAVIDEQEMMTAIHNDARNVDRLADRAYSRDFQRLGFGHVSGGSVPRTRAEPWRISLVNLSYAVCKSYPAVLVVPAAITDESIRKFARSHRQYRFPVVTWRHPRTRAVLLRASGFHGKGVMGMLKTHTPGQHSSTTGGTPPSSRTLPASSTETTSTSLEQEKYFGAVVGATPLAVTKVPTAGGFRQVPIYQSDINPYGPVKYRKSARKWFSKSDDQKLEKFQQESEAYKQTLGRFGMKTDSRGRPTSTIGIPSLSGGSSYGSSVNSSPNTTAATNSTTSSKLQQNGTLDSTDSTELEMQSQGLHKASLYVLGEKPQVKGIKLDSFQKCDFIPVEYYEVRHVKSSFKKLMRACVSSTPFTDPEKGFLRAIEDSEWLPQLQKILQIAGATVDLLDVQGSSVTLCLEDGWDFTTQVVSVAQVLLDPHYRTVEGFCQLIEKEWLGFGHRFTHRSNQTAANMASGFAPVFLQFLDVVHQIHLQFPMSFEFNQHLLKFLAYHYVSNRFRTFMLDNEFERMEAGWLLEESQRHKQVYSSSSVPASIHNNSGAGSQTMYNNGAAYHTAYGNPPPYTATSQTPLSTYHQTSHNRSASPNPTQSENHQSSQSSTSAKMGQSIMEYIVGANRQSAVFYNFLFSPSEHDTVLRPYSNISNLKLWEYYLKEDLAHGPPYDLEVVEQEEHKEEEDALIDGPASPSLRKVINGCYNNMERLLPDACHYLMKELSKLEQELGVSESWKLHWEDLEAPPAEIMQRFPSLTTQACRSHGRTIHKRSTLELLVKGKLLGEAAKMFSQPHHFEKFTYTTPAYCDYCSHVLWGLVKTGMQCSDCKYNCHEKCAPHVPKNCTTRLRPVSEVHTSTASISKTSLQDTNSNTGEHRTFEGYLYKRGALLKGWKQRWFVLDSMKHQLRYYDTQEDGNCKGFIDLKEVVSVEKINNPQSLPKRSDENAVFELKTQKRQYNFLAPNAMSSCKWIDEINSCIQ